MKGYVDRFDSLIAGWAFDPSAPGCAVDIVIEHEGQELCRFAASSLRNDLIPVIGEGEHGFVFHPKEADGFDKDMRLQVFAVGEARHLLYEGDWTYQGIVAEGADGWLFLNKDSNQVNLRIAAKIGVEPDEVYRTALQFASREALLSQLNVPYIALIVPEKNVVCSKFFLGQKVSASRPVPLILEQTKKLGCRPIYPIAEFSASDVDLYYRTDTHTNMYGYDLIYRILQRELPGSFRDIKPPTVLNNKFCGDLGVKLRPVHTEAVQEYVRPATADHFYNYNRMPEIFRTGGRLRGEVVSVMNRNATKRLLVFGSSSAYHALPLLSHAFEHTLFIWENTFDYRIIQLFAPDCVLWLPAERFLPMQVDDLKGLPETLETVRNLLS